MLWQPDRSAWPTASGWSPTSSHNIQAVLSDGEAPGEERPSDGRDHLRARCSGARVISHQHDSQTHEERMKKMDEDKREQRSRVEKGGAPVHDVTAGSVRHGAG